MLVLLSKCPMFLLIMDHDSTAQVQIGCCRCLAGKYFIGCLCSRHTGLGSSLCFHTAQTCQHLALPPVTTVIQQHRYRTCGTWLMDCLGALARGAPNAILLAGADVLSECMPVLLSPDAPVATP